MKSTRRIPWLLMTTIILLDVAVWIFEKYAAMDARNSAHGFFHDLVTHWMIWLAVALGPVQLFVWRRILAHADLSYAYPMTSLAYPVAIFAAVFLFGERPTIGTWIGAALVGVGVALLSSERKKPELHERVIPLVQEVLALSDSPSGVGHEIGPDPR